jgi:hypothetical protein
MKNLRLLLLLISFMALVLLACNEKFFTGNVDCSNCYQEMPVIETLFVYLTFTDSIDEIPLVLFKGNADGGKTDWIDTARAEDGNPYWVTVDVGIDYSVRAEYRLTGKTIYAVDGTRLKAKHVSGVCDLDCYVVENNELNLELKEDFLK